MNPAGLLSTASPWNVTAPSSSNTKSNKPRRSKSSTKSGMTIQDSVKQNEATTNRVNQLLNDMKGVSADNDGSSLGRFVPPPPPQISDFDKTETTGFASPFQKIEKSGGSNHIYQPYDNTTKEGFTSSIGKAEQFQSHSADYNNSYNGQLSEAMKVFANNARAPGVYTPSTGIYGSNTGSAIQPMTSMGGGPIAQDQVLEKLNHLIRLLEEQQHERTEHVTEEFLLYIFLGIFVIYIVDSFSRSGKYIR